MNNEELIEKGLKIATQTKTYIVGKDALAKVPAVFQEHFAG